jgi:hypothetical protein
MTDIFSLSEGGRGDFRFALYVFQPCQVGLKCLLIGLIWLKPLELKSSVFQPPFEKGVGIYMVHPI